MSIEGIVDQGVVIAVDGAVVVEVAVQPAGEVLGEAVVNLDVVGAVYFSVEIGVAEIGEFDEYVGVLGGDIVEIGVEGGAGGCCVGAVLDGG